MACNSASGIFGNIALCLSTFRCALTCSFGAKHNLLSLAQYPTACLTVSRSSALFRISAAHIKPSSCATSSASGSSLVYRVSHTKHSRRTGTGARAPAGASAAVAGPRPPSATVTARGAGPGPASASHAPHVSTASCSASRGSGRASTLGKVGRRRPRRRLGRRLATCTYTWA